MRLREWINGKAMSERVVNETQVMPTDMLERQTPWLNATRVPKRIG